MFNLKTRGESTLFPFFFAIFLFRDFHFDKDRVFLDLKTDELTKDNKKMLSWFLKTINNETGQEFYFLENESTTKGLIELKCNSDPLFFKNMKKQLKILTSVEYGT
ncbi:MAG: hypothetical protein ACTSW1_05985 [Candidatus Hodarchaeales archaeon]